MNSLIILKIHNAESISAFTAIKFIEVHFKGNDILSCKPVVSEFTY